MLSAFRNFTKSKVGLFVTFSVLALIALAFAVGDITGMSNGPKGLPTDTVATVGKSKVTEADLTRVAQDQMENFRQQQPTLDMVQFVAQGGLNVALEQNITDLALEQFGKSQGMLISKKLVDGEIASAPVMQNANGQFSQLLYDRFLQERRTTDAAIRADVTRGLTKQQLFYPILTAKQVPDQLALPYASLLLERREGDIGFIPTEAMGTGTAPTDAEVAAWYKSNIARYTLGERRVIRYAMVTDDQVKAQTTPTEAELQAAYKDQSPTFAPSEKRSFAQVIVADQNAANALAAKVKAGTPIDAAARAIGLEASTLTALDKTTYTSQSSAAAADAIFGAAKGAVVGPVRGAIGFVVARVDAITNVPGKTFAEARPELLIAVTKDKTAKVLTGIRDKIDDSLSGSATFDEVVADQKLSPSSTSSILANGTDPDNAAIRAAPDFGPIIAAAFAAEAGDSPQMVPMGKDGGFALVGLGKVTPPTARPLAQVRDTVARDFALNRARAAARKVAGDIVAKASKGTALTQLFAATGLKTPPVQPLKATRAQIASNPGATPPPLTLMFSMKQGTAKLLEAPNNAGWFVIDLKHIERGNAAGQPNLIAAKRGELSSTIGREYGEQFARAVQKIVGVKKNDKAVGQVKAQLTGQGGSN